MIEDKNNQNNEVEMFKNYKNIVLKCRKQINKNSLNMFQKGFCLTFSSKESIV